MTSKCLLSFRDRSIVLSFDAPWTRQELMEYFEYHDAFTGIAVATLNITMELEACLDSGHLTDVEFEVPSAVCPDVPERKFRAHKRLLALRSEVFGAMFFGNLAEGDIVNITDVHPQGFEVMLRSVIKPAENSGGAPELLITHDILVVLATFLRAPTSSVTQTPQSTLKLEQSKIELEASLDSGRLTDVEFKVRTDMFPNVGESNFRAHKLFLALRSEAFDAMFFEDLAEQGIVDVTDIHPDSYDIML
ncbi:hypothetical protein V5799_014183, partial [Amblyomma americanum]